ncbi:hypothetical protein PENSPDRAFT_390000 [Peniophora sp. CONT]|nr:hypothetical protein PENSPDRAFT_390000 [Peniophora sp. CONT]
MKRTMLLDVVLVRALLARQPCVEFCSLYCYRCFPSRVLPRHPLHSSFADNLYREEDDLYVSIPGCWIFVDEYCAEQHCELHQGGGEGVWRRTLGISYYHSGGDGGVIEFILLAFERETLSEHTNLRICV